MPNKNLEIIAFELTIFALETFLFEFYIEIKEPFDIDSYILLVVTVTCCIYFILCEINYPDQIIFTYGRILFTIVQGTWFYQMGFAASLHLTSVKSLYEIYMWHLILTFMFLMIVVEIFEMIFKCRIYDFIEDIEKQAQFDYEAFYLKNCEKYKIFNL